MNETKYIDLTPTWGAIGEMYIRLAESNEQAALRQMADEIRRAFAIATAAVAVSADWDEPQKAAFDHAWRQELAKRVKDEGRPEPRTYTYHINKNERGEFSADVRDENGTTVYEVTGWDIIERGYMDHDADMGGLQSYLASLNIIPADSDISFMG